MSAIEKVNNSGLSVDEKNALKTLMAYNPAIRGQIEEDSTVNDGLLLSYLKGPEVKDRDPAASKKTKVEIVIKQEGNFLDLTDVPSQLKLRSGLRKYLFIRECYDEFIADIVASLSLTTTRKTVAVLGTAGIGKSSLLLVCLKKLFDNPANLVSSTRSFYFQTRAEKIWVYEHLGGNTFSVRLVQQEEQLSESMILFVDMETKDGSPTEHAGICLIFTSFRPSRFFKELTKQGWHKVMPTWSAEEQAEYFKSSQFEAEYSKDIAQRAYDNIRFFGGSIRKNIMLAVTGENPVNDIEEAIIEKGEAVAERFFKVGFGGTEDIVSDVLVHRNPQIVDHKYNFHAKPCVYSFASPYVLQRLLILKNNMLATEAKNKYNTGTFRGGDDGNEFELLCLHAFKISGVEFLAQPLTDGAQATSITFPPKQVLALNWRQQDNYLEDNVLYIPPYGTLESGDAFCLININGRRTLIILQCTIAENHPVKQNGVKIIHDCYTQNANLNVDDTVIMFMIPVRGKLKTKQPLVTPKKNGALQEVQHVTISVTSQYKIENELIITVDDR